MPKCHSVKVLQFQSATVSKCQSATMSKCHSVKVPQCQSATVSKCQSATVSKCHSVKVPRCQSTTVSKCQSTTVSKCHSVKVPQCQSVFTKLTIWLRFCKDIRNKSSFFTKRCYWHLIWKLVFVLLTCLIWPLS